MKFAPTLLIASVLGAALASAQPLADPQVDRRNLVIETVYETVAPHVAKAGDNPVVVVTVTATAYGSPAAATVTSSAIAHEATPTSSAAHGNVAAVSSTPVPVAHTPQKQTTPAAVVVATRLPSAVVASPSPTSSSAVAAAATTEAAATTSASDSSSSGSSSGWMNLMLSELNSIRAAAGKSALKLSSELTQIAQKHSEYQASAKSMTHSDPSGTLGSRLSADGVSWQGAAENIAWNQQNVASVIDAWKNSAGHYANMIGDYTSVGFGVSDLYWTQDFIKA
ncbi:hypothetical protein IW140_005830 [Coemansia sp. RSA 1813]|nr:hypothetical protein EV178_004290 [Coemansia sp. RSA 1646]KAJ1770862.1 hypothetical protein LPJ74_002848 [Coemansia sp. RSA 1843]KAJ2088853.1 hypothetical protein IW138_003925 [Coemansia sp. RSA 986]KAJ2211150.1 hypothetical protein EV179_005729 [Coemansia sp. RSA 487]KAJ2564196.1 hypothetical protein IW140_005830 [Coemansia sp. RSA 1813]